MIIKTSILFNEKGRNEEGPKEPGDYFFPLVKYENKKGTEYNCENDSIEGVTGMQLMLSEHC